MMDQDDTDISNYYGVWPTLIGVAFGGGLMVFMFAVADGFTH